jgi:hypothetical protein
MQLNYYSCKYALAMLATMRCGEAALTEPQQHCIREISQSTQLVDKKRHALAPKTAAKKLGSCAVLYSVYAQLVYHGTALSVLQLSALSKRL